MKNFEMFVDYLGYFVMGMMVALALANVGILVLKGFHRDALVKSVLRQTSWYVWLLRFGGAHRGDEGRKTEWRHRTLL